MASKLPKLLFHHIPKTGGQSFTHLLRSIYTNSILITSHKVFDAKVCADYDLILGHMSKENYNPISNFEYTDRLYITIFRDPIKRVISHYNYVLKLYKFKSQDFSLKEFLFLCESHRNVMYTNTMGGNIDRYDIILFLETLQEDTNTFLKRYNLPNRSLPHVNSTRQLYKPSSEDIELIKEVNYLDIELYNKVIERKNY